MNPKVLVAVACGKQPVIAEFYDCFYTLQLPEGSAIQRAIGGSLPKNRNIIIDTALAGDYTHVFLVDDDLMFDKDIVLRLLAHDKDVVAGLCLQRADPFGAYVFSGESEIGELQYKIFNGEEQGLIKVHGVGTGGILIKRGVFSKLKKPYFYIDYRDNKEWGDDILFNRKLIDAGIEIWCDTSIIMQHFTGCFVFPRFKDNRWFTCFRIGESIIEMPAAWHHPV